MLRSDRSSYSAVVPSSFLTTLRHRAWIVAAVTLGALVAAAAFRSSTGVLMEPIEREFGWSRSTTSGAVSLNLLLYGLVAPFAAAVMERWGVRRTVTGALIVVGAASAATTVMTAPWQLWLLWGLLIGTGTGCMALVFGAVVANRWFHVHRGLVMGIFSAANATGQLVFLPLIAATAVASGWRAAALIVAALAGVSAIAVVLFLRDHPQQVGLQPFGIAEGYAVEAPQPARSPARLALGTLARASHRWTFWALALSFFVCGWTTNGLVQTHFIPAAHDHGMPMTTAAGLLALVGIFDVIGTVLSGWLTDRVDPRLLLAVYYALRGVSLLTCSTCWRPLSSPQCSCSSSSMASTGWPQCHRRWPCVASGSAYRLPELSSAGSLLPTWSVPPPGRVMPGGCGRSRVRTPWRGSLRRCCVSRPR